ncbi:MAG: hypothetical protein R3327_06560 [Nitrosopumilaceae archaeon]|nr:hypothetical protein [Nitrosopumilaceae archaeon]
MDDESKKMIDAIYEFGLDLSYLEKLLDRKTIEDLHGAIIEYKQNRNSSQSPASIW